MEENEEILSLTESLEKLLFSRGWNRILKAESEDESDIVKISHDSSDRDPEIVGMYSKASFSDGKVSMMQIQFDCRQFLIKNDLIK